MQRKPSVSGQFYPGNAAQLRVALGELIVERSDKRHAYGIVAPHAGYMYSGGIAGKIYGRIKIPETVLIIGPNHHGMGESCALYPSGQWMTPLGPSVINADLNSLLLEHTPYLSVDEIAHTKEHSLEVQLPFLQFLRPDVTLSAICIGHGDFSSLKAIGEGIANAIRYFYKDVLIVASSDMTHYETADVARRKDNLALARILAFDPEGLLQVCRSERISMCGVVPAVIMMVAARSLGATKAELEAYANSGDVTGDHSQVVGYASLAVQ